MNYNSPHFYNRDTLQVAQDLLGAILVRHIDGIRVAGIIVEVEAYCGLIDAASHAYKGKTERNKSMFGPVGHAYVYFIYGAHYSVNIVSRLPNVPAGGVLIRALQPVEGLDYMHVQRKQTNPFYLTNGPGKLAQALAIDKKLDGITIMQPGQLFVEQGPDFDRSLIQASPRIGISLAQDHLWRFFIKGNPWVSHP